MKILALETSAIAASAALCEDETLLAQSFAAAGLNHSRTLLPMVDAMLASAGLSKSDIDLVAVAAGPGSFTGLRIGVAAAKGLAWAGELPCAGVSTLEAMAWNIAHMDGEICCAMDARRNQIYNARFRAEAGRPVRITEDRAIALEDLAEELKNCQKKQIIVGDGAVLCYNNLTAAGLDVCLAPPNLRLQAAWGVARAALEMARRGETLSARDLVPAYHRLSQAERERQERLERAAEEKK